MTHLIEDEIQYLYLGVEELRSFFSFDSDRLNLSYEDTFPDSYKFAGFSIFRSFDEEVIQRETYDILNFLGDVGGLETVLTIVGGFIISSLINFIMKSRFFEKLYYYRPSDNLMLCSRPWSRRHTWIVLKFSPCTTKLSKISKD